MASCITPETCQNFFFLGGGADKQPPLPALWRPLLPEVLLLFFQTACKFFVFLPSISLQSMASPRTWNSCS